MRHVIERDTYSGLPFPSCGGVYLNSVVLCVVVAVTQATDIYKKLLLENRDDLALNVYVAMCYYKLDYYDVSLEILTVYLQVTQHDGS